MATNIVQLRDPRGQKALPELLESVTVHSADDIVRAAEALKLIAEERGLRVALCEDISSNEPMTDGDGTILNADVFGWLGDGERWWEDHRLALSSPLPRACRYESEPFWANADGIHGHWKNVYLEEMDLADFEKRSLCKAAIVVPVHLPFAQISANSFVPLDKDVDELSAAFAEHSELLAQVTRRFMGGYVNAMRSRRLIPSDCMLSKREVECLRWAAIGKTDKEISMILSRSHATVRYHVHRAGEKLNSVNRSQAVFKAGQLGYLGASD